MNSSYSRGKLECISVALFCFLGLFPQGIFGVEASPTQKITFQEYYEAIERLSPDLAGQRQNIIAAKGGISVARIRPDPQFTGGIDSKELASENKPNASLVTVCEVGVTIETAGKRRKRIQSARTGVKMAEGNVRLFLRQLKSESAAAFIEACRLKEALKRKQSSFSVYEELIHANEARFKAGDIGKLELRQSRVEANRFQADVEMAKAEAQVALVQLSGPLGKRFEEVFPQRDIDSQLPSLLLNLELDELIQRSLDNDEEIRVTRISVDAARNALELARANRSVDPTFNIGLTNSPRVGERFDLDGMVTNSPAARSLTLGLTVSVPIPLSNRERGALTQAESALKQAELQVSSTEAKVETEIRGAFTKYRATIDNLQRYREQILDEADQVLDAVRKSYRMGEASLLELLDAQRTADDVYLGYLQALADFTESKVKLQVLAGIPIVL
ncbi:MAG: TolC family protein [Candidatus Ozemobacteraceae bacterium]